MATLMLSQGVPLILAGDEFLRTQHGNNYAWCQDNETSWVDWRLVEQHADFLRFTRELIWFRRRHPALRRRRFFRGNFERGGDGSGSGGAQKDTEFESAERPRYAEPKPGKTSDGGVPPALADILWHGVEPDKPDWGPESRMLAFSLDGRCTGREGDPDNGSDCDFYIAMNARHEAVNFRVPLSPTRRRWRRVVDTAKPAPYDFVLEAEGPLVYADSVYPVAPRSLIVLVSEM
jgi:isoamylase